MTLPSSTLAYKGTSPYPTGDATFNSSIRTDDVRNKAQIFFDRTLKELLTPHRHQHNYFSQLDPQMIALGVSKMLIGGVAVGGVTSLIQKKSFKHAVLIDMGAGLMESCGIAIAEKMGIKVPVGILSAAGSMVTATLTQILLDNKGGKISPVRFIGSLLVAGAIGFSEYLVAENGLKQVTGQPAPTLRHPYKPAPFSKVKPLASPNFRHYQTLQAGFAPAVVANKMPTPHCTNNALAY